MPLNERQTGEYFSRELTATSFAVFRDVRLPAEYLTVQDGEGAAVLIKRRQADASCLILIGADVRYVGQDASYRRLFASETQRGWRVLAAVKSIDPAVVLRETDALLGLGNERPRLVAPKPQDRPDIMVRPEELLGEHRDPRKERLDEFGVDLVAEARAGRMSAPLFRDEETQALVRVLSKADKKAACLVGPPGVGKTAVVEGLAVRIAHEAVPDSLVRARILDVNLSFLAAGASYKNEFEGRLRDLLELARHDRNVILFLDEIHVIRGGGSDGSQHIKSDLGRGRIRCIGATTNSEFRTLEADAALARRFQAIPVQEPTPGQSLEILRAVRARFEEHHGVSIPDEQLQSVVKLACRFVPERHLPDKALDLLDEACACARIGRVPTPSAKEASARTVAGDLPSALIKESDPGCATEAGEAQALVPAARRNS